MVHVHFTPAAKDDLGRIHKSIAQRILTKIRWLSENYEAITPEPLTGQWEGVLKLRVGDYRVLYTYDSDASTITVHIIRHRREVYRGR
ncbi:MAG: type II toxin-antitoxin system RelE/ParE family toxin [Caldilineaceae bacterium]|nr:type II toxin-antitoxin system RelE/ParE family toxin [Caldilineaceae bacterium]